MSEEMEFLEQLVTKENPTWWERAAADATFLANMRHIRGRHDNSLYLSRFWLTPPVSIEAGDLESGNSTLLHYFHRGDDDDALHDHPWDFDTTILSGGYTEQLPEQGWDRAFCYPNPTPGPELYSEYSHKRRVGDRIFKKATDLHMAMKPLPGTWTMVTTGKRVRDWGFHAPGEKWVGWREYLGIPA